MLNLYQAEWCPYSSAVRERLTELGLDFVARQVAPWPEERHQLVDKTGTDEIPVLEDDGTFYTGIQGGSLAQGAAIGIFMFPVLLGVCILMLRRASQTEVV